MHPPPIYISDFERGVTGVKSSSSLSLELVMQRHAFPYQTCLDGANDWVHDFTFSSALCMSVLFVEMKCQRDFLFSSVSSSLSFLSLLFSFPLPFSLPPSFSLCPYLYLCLLLPHLFLHTRAFAVPFSVYGYIFHSFFLSILFLSHSLPPSISFSFSSSSFSLLPFPFLFHLFLL